MRSWMLVILLAAFPVGLAAAQAPVPQGILPDAVAPITYRLDLTIQPDLDRFSGHAAIDVTLKAISGEIDCAFDAVTYGKGGQVVGMIAAISATRNSRPVSAST